MKFHPVNKPLICKPVADALLQAQTAGKKKVRVSLDLGKGVRELELSDDGVFCEDFRLGWEDVRIAAKRGRDIYYVEENHLVPLSISSGHFYKLVLVKWGHAPTLEIDGIHMHRIVDVTPEADSELKISMLGRLRCCRVLDVCTGLGYTAIAALRKNACKIVTIEKDENVVRLARFNPWSWELADDRIELRIGDAVDLIEEYSEEFDAVIHDPPRLALAGELYGLEFYRKLARALKPGGRIVHYVGQPGIRRGKKVWRGVLERMRAAGFDAAYDESSRCVYGRRKR
ncbi:MAG: methyltransferase domain-containing protein [Thaumarchaeota archaeon]|nr:methyltransferase domain-containing protein [Nitrososphaerota archaeon]